jgi:hypothetical protein
VTFYEINDVEYIETDPSDLDVLFDAPTNGTQSDTGAGGEVSGNYATWNALGPGGTSTYATLSNGNLKASLPASGKSVFQTIFPQSGKWYVEIDFVSGGGAGGGLRMGVINENNINKDLGSTADSWAYLADGRVYHNGSAPSYGVSSAPGDLLMMALDIDGGKIWYGKNGSWMASGDPANGSNASQTFTAGQKMSFSVQSGSGTVQVVNANWGQRAWTYTAPSGFKAVCTTNLATPTIADGSAHVKTGLYTGTGSSSALAVSGPSNPDFVWIKSRSGATSHALYDAIRGFDERLYSNSTTAPYTYGSDILVPTSTGFNLTTTDGDHNTSSATYAAWQWDAGANSNKTYTVTVVSDSGNKYRFDGHGTSAVTLDLAEGSTYVFDQSDSSNSGHPLRFSTTSDGTHGGGSEYTTGVTTTGTPGSAGAKTTIVVASGAPTLYYYCTNHSGMGGQANTNSTAGSTRLSSSLNASFYDQSVVWSNLLASTGTVINATNGFNGVLSNVAQAESGSYTLTIDLSNRGFTGDVEWYNANGNVQGASLNGGTDPTGSGTSAAGWYTLGTLASGDSCAITFNGNGSTPYCAALRIGGKLLIDSGISLSSFTQYPSINSVVKANPEAGFSVGTFTGTGSVGTVATGLTDTKMLILKNRDSSSNWVIYHTIVDGSYDYMYLNLTTANASSSLSHTMNTTFKVGTNTDTNASGDDYSFIAFEPVAGYSVFGTYESNGSADGPFVWTGFRPSVIIGKRSDATNGWFMFDSARDSYNVADAYLAANASAAEATYTFADFLSNGFKLRATTSDWNGSGGTVLYMAFAENPFQANGGLAR